VNEQRRDLLAVVAIVLAHGAALAVLLIAGASFYYEDFERYHLPLRVAVVDALREGQLPLWNPYVFLGAPLAANPLAQVFYPPGWPLLLLEETVGLNALVVLHLAIGAVGTFLLARGRASRTAALCAALSFSLGGIAISYTTNPPFLCSLAWLPLVLLGYRHAVERDLVGGACGAAAALALLLLAGDVQLAITSALILAILAAGQIALAAPGGWRSAAGRASAALLLVFGLGVALAAVQLLPALEFAGLSERAAGVSAGERAEFSFHPARLVSLLLARAFGAQLPHNSFWPAHLAGGPRFWFFSIYAGALLLLLAIAALRRRDAWTLGLAVGGVVLVALATGRYGPVHELAERALPLLTQVRFPEKFLAPIGVLIPVLGAEGLDRVIAGEARLRVLGGLSALCLLGLAAWASQAPLRQAIAAYPEAAATAAAAAEQIAADGGLLALLAAAALALYLGGARRGWSTSARRAALAALVGIDLLVAGGHYLWLDSLAALRTPPALRPRLVGEDAAPPRLLRVSELDFQPHHADEAEWRRFAAYRRETFFPNLAARWRVGTLLAFGAGFPADVLRASRGIDAVAAPRWAAVLATGWIVRPGGGQPSVLPPVVLERLPGALPRARLTGAALVPDARALALVLGGHDFRRAAAVEPQVALEAGTPLDAAAAVILTRSLPREGGGSARVADYRANAVTVAVAAERPSLLVLAEAFFPGWRATVDGREVPIFRADLLGRAVVVPAGRHEVHFRFRATAVGDGARVSAVALVVLIVLIGVHRHRRRVRRVLTR
jgi:hypothetical protein